MKFFTKILTVLALISLSFVASASNLRQAAYMNNGLADLKLTQGDSTNTQAAWWFAIYPTITYGDRYIYLWDNSSTATPDDDLVVKPTAIFGAGRWLRINLLDVPQVNTDWNATSGVEIIRNKPTLIIGVSVNNTITGTISFFLPAGYYYAVRPIGTITVLDKIETPFG